MIIGISGKMGSGKDEVAKMIQELTNNNWETKRFADELKDTVCRWIGCTREQLEDREFKEAPLGEEWDCLITTSSYGAAPELSLIGDIEWTHTHKRQMTPRLMLQLLGTEAGRQIIHPNIWVNTLMSQYVGEKTITHITHPSNITGKRGNMTQKFLDLPNWIIPDTRFRNEVKAIEDRGGIVIRIERPHKNSCKNISIGEHKSETALDGHAFEYVIQNDGTLNDLKTSVASLLLDLNFNS